MYQVCFYYTVKATLLFFLTYNKSFFFFTSLSFDTRKLMLYSLMSVSNKTYEPFLSLSLPPQKWFMKFSCESSQDLPSSHYEIFIWWFVYVVRIYEHLVSPIEILNVLQIILPQGDKLHLYSQQRWHSALILKKDIRETW